MNTISKVVVIGASAGGLQAVSELVSKFPPDKTVAVFVVLHVSKQSIGPVIAQHIQKHTSMICKVAENGEDVKPGHLYISPPDYHMLIKKNKVLINKGPAENRWRPSIDVLFRSAAVAYNSQVIGIILTGLLDDGTSGMGAIKKSGGICIVQEPAEAAFSDMPTNVLNNVDVDFRAPIADMEYILQDLLAKPSPHGTEVPRELELEAQITERLTINIEALPEIATHTIFTCPDCGGGLWKINNDTIHRYRCHTGHVYTEKVLLQTQQEGIEETLWIAIRMLEEQRNLLLTLAGHERDAGYVKDEQRSLARADQTTLHIERLKATLLALSTE